MKVPDAIVQTIPVLRVCDRSNAAVLARLALLSAAFAHHAAWKNLHSPANSTQQQQQQQAEAEGPRSVFFSLRISRSVWVTQVAEKSEAAVFCACPPSLLSTFIYVVPVAEGSIRHRNENKWSANRTPGSGNNSGWCSLVTAAPPKGGWERTCNCTLCLEKVCVCVCENTGAAMLSLPSRSGHTLSGFLLHFHTCSIAPSPHAPPRPQSTHFFSTLATTYKLRLKTLQSFKPSRWRPLDSRTDAAVSKLGCMGAE